MQTESSHHLSSTKADFNSTTIIIHLVNPEQDPNSHIKQYRKPHISLTNFEKLIKPTPFQKFNQSASSLSQFVLRSNSSPISDSTIYDFNKVNLALRKIRSSQSSPTRSNRSRTIKRQGSTAPKSKFAIESQKYLEDLSP